MMINALIPNEVSLMRCAKCGSDNPEDKRICGACGSLLLWPELVMTPLLQQAGKIMGLVLPEIEATVRMARTKK